MRCGPPRSFLRGRVRQRAMPRNFCANACLPRYRPPGRRLLLHWSISQRMPHSFRIRTTVADIAQEKRAGEFVVVKPRRQRELGVTALKWQLSGSCERMENLCGIAKTIFPQWPEAIWVEWGVHVPQIMSPVKPTWAQPSGAMCLVISVGMATPLFLRSVIEASRYLVFHRMMAATKKLRPDALWI